MKGKGNTSRVAQIKERIVQEVLNSLRHDEINCVREEAAKDCISMWVSLLDNREKYYEGSKNESVLKDHVQSLKKGLEFLGKLYTFSTDRNLDESMRQLAVDVKHHSHTVDVEENEDLQRIMMILVNIIKNNDESFNIFKKGDLSRNYRSIIDLLLENISEVKSIWYNNNNAALDVKVGELKVALTYLKPLYICLAHSSHLVQMASTLDSVINDAADVIYLLFVDKMDKKTVVHRLNFIVSHLKEIGPDIYVRFLEFRSPELTSDMEGWLYILDNLIHILATNSTSLNEPNQHLYEELRELRTFAGGRVMLNNYCGINESVESICYQAVQIVSTIYVEETMPNNVDHILVSVVDKIKMFKIHSSQEIRLHEYPRVDGLGFLEFFLGRLKELQGQKKMSVMMSEIEALHFDFNFLLSSTKRSEEKLISGSHIVKLAYQAEYVIDLYLVLPDSRCISTLSHIVQELKEIKEKVLALPDKRLHLEDVKEIKEKVFVLPDKSLDVEDVALRTPKTVHGTPLHVDNELVGFQEEIVAIMNDLLAGESDLKVISVVGMAGAGKTSLAKHLFKECSHDGHFDKIAWCTVSQTYQMKDLLLTILKQIDPSKIRDMEDQALADEVCKRLRRSRYLVVFDDVWDVSVWNYLSIYFKNDRNKSRILITTRHHNVASGTKSNIHELRPLTEDESWELLQKKLSLEESLPEYNESIAKEVTKSCKGLPLSIVIIGSLLHHATKDEEMWNQIAKDVTLTILSDPGGECKAILELSYNHLPDNLKACFLYLGIFPEDHEISVTRLVRLWVAEGLVRGMTDSDVCVDDIGKRCVDDLIKRCLIIPIKEKTVGGVKTVKLHDLLRDFCLEKAKDENFFTVIYKGISDLPPCPRRISINGFMDKKKKEKRKTKKKNWPSSLSQNNVRTIICFDKSSGMESIVRSEQMLLLNVLEMAVLDKFPSYLHRYVHLKYLVVWNLLYSSISFFQESSISKLLNLEVLILRVHGNEVISVPDFIWDLVKLRHIDIRDSVIFHHHSKKIEDSTVILENLMSLSKASLHYKDSNWLRKLPKLQELRCRFLPSYDRSLKQYRFPDLNLCNRLTSLNVEYGKEFGGKTKRCKLQLPGSLRKLSLSKFLLIPDDLSGIGKSLPNLEVLKLLRCSIDKWSVEDEDFPNLKVLEIRNTTYMFPLRFVQWDASEDSFPKLEQLRLYECYNFKEIPLSFGDIPYLRLISIEHSHTSLHKSAREIQKIQAEAQNLELKVHIKGSL